MTAFDALRPPSQADLDTCVHCGFCLPTCPTYVLWGEEMDSPRGRIVLMEAARNETDAISDAMALHWDRCLGCMACVTACPSGVPYDRLLEDTRPQLERNYRRGFGARLSPADGVRDVHAPRAAARGARRSRAPRGGSARGGWAGRCRIPRGPARCCASRLPRAGAREPRS